MITYTWSISKLDCAPSENGLTNIVKIIHWTLAGVDENGVSSSISNSYPLSSPSPEAFAVDVYKTVRNIGMEINVVRESP